MKHATILTMMALIGMLAAVAVGEDKFDGRDQIFNRGNSDDSLLRGYVTYAREVDGKYVAYLHLQWGDVDSTLDGDDEVFSRWNGEVKVDDGVAEIVQTEGFETQSHRGTVLDKAAYWRAVDAYHAKRKAFVQTLDAKRQKERHKAMKTFGNGPAFQRELRRINTRYDQRLAGFDFKAVDDLAGKRRKLTQDVYAGPDAIGRGRGEKVTWTSTTWGGTDGVVVRLILDEPDSEVKVKVGSHSFEFDTHPVPYDQRHYEVASRSRQVIDDADDDADDHVDDDVHYGGYFTNTYTSGVPRVYRPAQVVYRTSARYRSPRRLTYSSYLSRGSAYYGGYVIVSSRGRGYSGRGYSSRGYSGRSRGRNHRAVVTRRGNRQGRHRASTSTHQGRARQRNASRSSRGRTGYRGARGSRRGSGVTFRSSGLRISFRTR